MLDRLRDMLRDRAAPASADPPEAALRLAAAALLVEAARMDDSVAADERERIAELVRWRFGLGQADAEALVRAAEQATEADPAHWHALTATLRQAFGDAERRQLVDMLWDVVYTDGVVHDLEASLMRRVAGLLNVSDQESGEARRRARARHGLSDEIGD